MAVALSDFVSIEHVARPFKVTAQTVRYWVKRGEFPRPLKVGRPGWSAASTTASCPPTSSRNATCCATSPVSAWRARCLAPSVREEVMPNGE
jgi:hypothetical protein